MVSSYMSDNTATSAIITGGTQGLGFAVALALAASGCSRLTLAGRSADKGEIACAALADGVRVIQKCPFTGRSQCSPDSSDVCSYTAH